MPQSEEVQIQTAPNSALSAASTDLVVQTSALTVDEPNGLNTGDVDGQGLEQDGAKVNSKRLYLSNVSYQTTEEDLLELLSEYEIVSVLVPSQTVRGFKSIYQKSLGIAYIDFQNEVDAELAKLEINGKIINDRILRVKSFVPYSPKNVFIRRSRSRRGPFHRSKSVKTSTTEKIEEDDEQEVQKSKVSNVIDEADKEIVDGGETPGIEESGKVDIGSGLNSGSGSGSGSGVSVESEEVDKKQEPETSKDTVFLSRLLPKVTDGDLREFFHEYSPTDVYIFKNRINKKQHPLRFHQRHVSALVTLAVENGVESSIKTLSDQKINGKPVIIRAAYISKIEDVKKAAELRQKKQAKLEQEASAAASAAASALPKEEPATTDHVEDSINVVKDDEDDESDEYHPEQALSAATA